MDNGDAQAIPSLQEFELAAPFVEEVIQPIEDNRATDPPEVPLYDGIFARPGFWLSVVWCLLLFATQVVIGIGLVVLALIAVIVQNNGPLDQSKLADEVQKVAEIWMLPIGSFSTVVVAFVITLGLFRTSIFRCMGFRRISPTHVALILMMSLPMGVLTSEFTNWVQYIFPNLDMLKMFADFSAQPFILVFIAGCVFPGLGEELFFRGFLSRGLVSRYGPFLGAVFASFLFGLIHVHPVQASGAFLLGLVLQYVFLATQSLWGAIVLHTANNALAFTMMAHGHRLPIPGLTIGSEEGIAHTPVLLVLAAMISAATLIWVLHRTRAKWIQPDGTTWSRGFVTAEGPSDPSIVCVAGPIQKQDLACIVGTYGLFIAATVASITA